MESDNMIRNELDRALVFLKENGRLRQGARVVIGCSTSEVIGGRIGKNSAPALGEIIAAQIIETCAREGLAPIFQCCEHLNRCLVTEREIAEEDRLVLVRAIPQPKAGGSVPAAAWKLLKDPVLALRVQCDAGMDIGDTLIGMHMRPVVVPVHTDHKRIGEANLVLARSRAKYTGGPRAQYDPIR